MAAAMELNTENFEYEDIWKILSLVEEAEYKADQVGGVWFHTFEVHVGEEIDYSGEMVRVDAGHHQLLLDSHTREWIGYVKQT